MDTGLDWDYDEPKSPYVFLSIYAPLYKADNVIKHFKLSELNRKIEDLKTMFTESKQMPGYKADEDEPILGLNSNSLASQRAYDLGYMFFEWDIDKFCPSLEEILSLGDIVSVTGRGYHAIKSDIIPFDMASARQMTVKCCEGFTKCTHDKGYSTLRVSPKEGRPIKIIKYTDGLLYNVYKQLVLEFGGIYEPIS